MYDNILFELHNCPVLTAGDIKTLTQNMNTDYGSDMMSVRDKCALSGRSPPLLNPAQITIINIAQKTTAMEMHTPILCSVCK